MTDQQIQEIVDAYYNALPNKEVQQPKALILFSGIPGSGKSAIARAIEEDLQAIRLSNDDVRDQIVAMAPALGSKEREEAKLQAATRLLERVMHTTHGLVVIDASVDRGYDFYRSRAQKYEYPILLLRLDIPLNTIKERIISRGDQGYRNVTDTLAQLDAWWEQWEAFGREHEADMTITSDIPTQAVVEAVRELCSKGATAPDDVSD